MIRGRHRGLPVAIECVPVAIPVEMDLTDASNGSRSILLPSDIASISPPTDAPGHVLDKPKSDLHEDRSNP
jgi:hypothetical protein